MNEIKDQESRQMENNPIETLPVLRHHLHEALWALNIALCQQQAFDLGESYRQGLLIPKESPLARQLERSHTTLSAYLGLLDEPGEKSDVSEDE